MNAIPFILIMWLQWIKWKLNYIDNKADKADHEKINLMDMISVAQCWQ